MQNSYGENEKNNRILKECALSRKKHEEVEKRYRSLVEPDMSYLIRIAKINEEKSEKERTTLKSGNSVSKSEYEKKPPEKKTDSVVSSGETEPVAKEPENSSNTEYDADSGKTETEIKPETENNSGIFQSEDNIPPKNNSAQTVSDNFRKYFEREISPILDKPEFGTIRDFIAEENDFSREEYQSILEEYDNFSENDGSEEEPADTEQIPEYSAENVGVVYAVPLENQTESSSAEQEPLRIKIFKGAMALIVLITATAIVYNIW